MAASLSNITGVGLVTTITNPGTITLPLVSETPNRQLIFKDAYGNFSNLPLTFQTQGGDTFEDTTTSKVINNSLGSITFYGFGNKWYVIGGTQQVAMTVSSLTVSSINSLIPGNIILPNLTSTVTGLGSAGYISSTAGLIDISELTSTVTGLGSANYVSTTSLLSTTAGLIDIPELTSTVSGLGNAGYITTVNLLSTTAGLIDIPELTSTVTGLGSAGYVSTITGGFVQIPELTSTVTGLGTASYVSTLSLISTTNFISRSFSSFSTAFGPGGGGGLTTGNLNSTVAGLGTAGYLSSLRAIPFLSAFTVSSGAVFTSSISATTVATSSLQVNSLIIGSGTGWLNLGPLQTVAISSVQANTDSIYAENTYLGLFSTATALQFYGLQGNYNNTVIAEVSTGGATQELLFFKGNSATDRIRFQTTGNIRFESGVSSRLWNSNTTATQSNAIPAMIITNTSNVGINCNAPATTLDVNGTIQSLSTTILRVGRLFDYASHPFSNNSFYLQNVASTLQIGLNNYPGALVINYNAGIAISTPRVGIQVSNPEFGLDVTNGDFRVCSNSGQLGLRISSSRNAYSILQLGGGNSRGFLWGAFNGWQPNGDGDGINLSYNFYNDDSGIGTGNRILQTAGPTSYINLGYGRLIFGTSTANAPPQIRMLINQFGNVGINCNVPTTTLDVNGTIRGTSILGTNSMTTSSMTTSSISFGASQGWVTMNALQAIVVSSIQTNTALGYVSSLLVGVPSTNNFQIPAFNLQLVQNSAAKPVTNTWTIGSDMRIKENVTDANLDRCYEDIRTVKLRRFAWREDYFNDVQATDKNVLGFIAQEVSTIVPKAVEVKRAFGYSDFQFLNIDQLNMSLYGAVKRVIQDKEYLESTVKGQRFQIETLVGTQTFIFSTLNGLQGR